MSIDTDIDFKRTSKRPRVEPEAYLNLTVRDARGAPLSIKCYIPLTSDNNVHKAIMEKARTNKEIPIIGNVKFEQTEEIVL